MRYLPLLLLPLLLLSCQKQPAAVPLANAEPPEKLSAFGLFAGPPAAQQAAPGVLTYELNTPLFSDYTAKHRFIKLPPGQAMKYHADAAFDFPAGTVIAKTFAYPEDLRDPHSKQRLIETRILRKEADGNWSGFPYRWNHDQSEATLALAGGTQQMSWIHHDGGNRGNNYIIPNANQCKGCHENLRVQEPIGPKARQLNRPRPGGGENQLEAWHRAGLLQGMPALPEVPKVAVWNDPHSGTLEQRARAWLDINCAHCHNPAGPARTSGLDLRLAQAEPVRIGLWKTPVAAGRGSGGRHFDIVPGKPDESILVYRIESTEPGVMMPELPRRLVDEEGVSVIREWIASMPPGQPPRPAAAVKPPHPAFWLALRPR